MRRIPIKLVAYVPTAVLIYLIKPPLSDSVLMYSDNYCVVKLSNGITFD